MSITTKSLYESVVLDDLPRGYWGLDTADPTVDDSGNGNTLTATGAPANNAKLLPAGDTGASGARDFSGAGQYYTAADDPDLDLADEFTLEAWVSFDSVAGTMTLLSKGTNAYQLRRNGTAMELHQEGVGIVLSTTGVTLAITTVYHVVAVKNGSSYAKIYVNGVDRSGAVTSRTCTDTSTALNIGRKSDNTELLNGRLDEVAVYAYAFTADMVTTHYNAGNAGTFGQQILQRTGVWPSVKVEIAWDSKPRDTYQKWRDVTSYVREAGWIRGRNMELDRVETMRIDLLLNNNHREFDDTYASSPFYPNVKPTKAVRIRAQISDSQTYAQAWGYTEGWPLKRLQAGKASVAQITASGPFKALALDKITDTTSRPEELGGARLAAVLAVPGLRTSLDVGRSTVSAADLDQARRLEHALDVAASDGGVLFEAGDGTLTFHDRHHRLTLEGTVRATYGDGGGSELPLAQGFEPRTDEARLFTAAVVTGVSGVPQEAEDTAASDEHFKRTKEVGVLTVDDNVCLGQAQAYAYNYSTPRSIIPSMPLNPAMYAADRVAAWKTALGHEISHRIQSKERPVGDTSVITRDHFVEGVQGKINAGRFDLTLTVSPAELESEYWILGTGELGDTAGTTNTRLFW